jgi:hypothetical protein
LLHRHSTTSAKPPTLEFKEIFFQRNLKTSSDKDFLNYSYLNVDETCILYIAMELKIGNFGKPFGNVFQDTLKHLQFFT